MALSEKVALITGGGTGIGKAISRSLAKEGVRVAIASREAAHVDAARDALRHEGCEALAFCMDVRKRDDVEKTVKGVLEHWGTIDILVNNSGVSGMNPMNDSDDGRWYDILDTNLTGVYVMTKEVLKAMKRNGSGRVINIASVLGKFGVPGYTAYCASKHGLIGFTRALALEVVERGITVNAICPGWVETEMARQGIAESAATSGITAEEFETKAIDAVPIKRFLVPQEVAQLVLYLASDHASGITGQAINICGGQTMV